jgi:type II secretory pathway component GspD/PulD (secretin)
MMLRQGATQCRLACTQSHKIGLVSILLCLMVPMSIRVSGADQQGADRQLVVAPSATEPLNGEQARSGISVTHIEAAEQALAHGDYVAARDYVQKAVAIDPSNESARVLLARIDSQLSGAPKALDGDPVDGDLRQQAMLAEARMLVARAELLASGERFEAAVALLSQARINILPYAEREVVRSELQRIDSALVTYRSHQGTGHDRVLTEGREVALEKAQRRQQDLQAAHQSLLDTRIDRVEELEAKAFYESALAACRLLLTDYPDNQRVQSLYARLITKAHKQRGLTLDEQRTELLQEVHERIERSLNPQGFDGWPSYPKDWAERNQTVKQFDAPVRLEPWEEALNEKLGARLSYDFNGQNAIEVLNSLAKQANINLIIDPAVLAGGDKLVTLKANDMTFQNTLSWVCRQADTTWHSAKGAVYVGGEQETKPILAIYEVSDILFAPKDQVGKQLAFNNATGAGGAGGGFNLFQSAVAESEAAISPEDFIDLIQKAVTPTVWANTAYGITVRGMTLMVTAPTATHLLIQQFIRSQAHVKNKLVRIDARWITIKDGYLEEIGVDWRSPELLALPNPGLPVTTTTPVTGNGFHSNSSSFDHAGVLTNNLPATATIVNPPAANTGLNWQVAIFNSTQASAVISAVERNRIGTILESPSLVTMNGVRGSVFMGSEYAYISDYGASGSSDLGLNPGPEISVLHLGTSLDIKPYISADGKYVTMEFRPAVASLQNTLIEFIGIPVFAPPEDPDPPDDPDPPGIPEPITERLINLELPNVLVREVSTNITIPDGGTMLIGGFGALIEQQTSSHVPFLGHIPFLGRLFGKRGRYSDRYQLYLLADINIINYAELEAKL